MDPTSLASPCISPAPSLELTSWGLALGLGWEWAKGSGAASMARAPWLRLMALVQGGTLQEMTL